MTADNYNTDFKQILFLPRQVPVDVRAMYDKAQAQA